ncbi:MAG: hypothetical protein Q8M94_00655, partial [Ignavibacteria bacterium]|nr:hypothetical protein [Ignavibacteria bacterium]
MSDHEKIMLFKIASEINLGRDAVVQFLQQKGFVVENKPTALLSVDMVEAIYDKFKREKKAAEKQREKVEKLKASRKPVEVKKTTPAEFAKTTDKHEELPFVETISLARAEVIIHTEPVVEPTPVIAEVIVETPSLPEVEIIDIVEPVPEPVSELMAELPVPVVEDIVAAIKPEQLVEIIKERTIPLVQEIISVIPDDGVDEDDSEKIIEKSADGTPLNAEESAQAKKNRKRKKRKKIIEVEYEIGQAPKLKGLTIVGKINLDAEKEERIRRAAARLKTSETPAEAAEKARIEKNKKK